MKAKKILIVSLLFLISIASNAYSFLAYLNWGIGLSL